MGQDRAKLLLVAGADADGEHLTALLKGIGVAVERHAHPHDVLFGLEEPRPHLILLSLPIKGMSIGAFLASLSSQPVADSLPVVVIYEAGSLSAEELAELSDRGIAGSLARPFDHVGLGRLLVGLLPGDVGTALSRSYLPSMVAHIDGQPRRVAVEMAISKSLMVLLDGPPISVGTEFRAELSYRDPAPSRNRSIGLQLQLRVGSCSPAEGGSVRCSLRVQDVRPAERWSQYVRVCRAHLDELSGD